jgi:ribosomal protein S18 acetylase RimI-like enzyme
MRIGLATNEQTEQVVLLLAELNAHYNPNSPAPREVVREHLVNNLLSSASQRLVVAAGDSGNVVGLAAIMLVCSIVEPEPDRRLQCQLKELYVSKPFRGTGTGKALMHWVASYAAAHGCSRIDWHVKSGNASGIAFYKRLGASVVEDRLSFRLNQSSLTALAGSARSVA